MDEAERDAKTRQEIIALGVELITFSYYHHGDERMCRHFKAWSIKGIEILLTQTQWISVHGAIWQNVPSEGTWDKVWGWQVMNNRFQIATANLKYTHKFEDPEMFEFDGQNMSQFDECLEKYFKASQAWGGESSDPNREYELSNNLQQMLEASRWSPTDLNAEQLLEYYLKHADEFVRSSLAANPNTPEEVLVQLGYDHSPFVRNSIRMNPEIPEWLQKTLGKTLE
jgi:hypothetical protein